MGRSSHHSVSKVGRRRSQLALKKLQLSPCAKCKAPTMPHKACPQCGFYLSARASKKSSATK
jgi:ribosomal protein L32